MAAVVHHRGPDESGLYRDGALGFAHTRLSIIDLATGQQPMKSPESRVAITFNGEIYNYVELREELERAGHRFATQSDTEVILHAYEEYGVDCVERMNGQWAFAIWDPDRRRLFLSRDRLGIRPLHYGWAGRDFVFASEVKSLLAHPAMEARVDLEALDDIFTFWVPTGGRTFFTGVSELLPGHNLILEDGRARTQTYWRLDYPTDPDLDEREAVESLAALLRDAVRLRMRADVPVGAYLSGGLDSSLTVAMIERFTDAPLKTFSVTFADAEFDESEHQKLVVEANGTEHASVACAAADIGAHFPAVIRHVERPILRTAPTPLFALSRLVREHGFKVVVTGEGADELFGGYDIFKEAKIRRFWRSQPSSTWRPLLLRRLYPYMPALQAQSTDYLKAFFHVDENEPVTPGFSHVPRWELTAQLKQLFSPDVRAALAGRDAVTELEAGLPEAFPTWHPFCQAQYLETAHLLPGYILSSQGDRVAMANSVEGRFPFLDHRVAEAAARLPVHLKMRVLDEKYLLKRIAEGLVPPAVIRRPKQPYRAPDVPAFFFGRGGGQHEWVRQALSPEAVEDVGLFAPRAVAALVRKCERGIGLGIKDSMALVGILSAQLVVTDLMRGSGGKDTHGRD
jgi:asparagine synthase (glutamine-hydrolysing)